ncbi:MAG TPA: ABC transporter permease [Kofleriaceae bacterium]|jgi:putative ABC transport system permease protein|nr:ABC transporter permease [Kofleriaceae bacterium]
MFSADRWGEVLSTLAKSPLRSILTALAVAWGIFMLVVLLGMGRGLRTGTEKSFSDDATNSVWVFGGSTSKPHQGLPVNRRIIFDNGDYDALREVEGIDKLTGRFFGGVFGNETRVRVGAKVSSFDVRSVHPDHLYLEKTIMVAGRYLNETDLRERRKVAVVGVPVAEFLWGHTDVIGQWLEVNGVSFQVIGIFTDEGDAGELRKLYIPITTAQLAFNGADRINMMMFTVGDKSVAETKALVDDVTELLAERERFAPDDPQAMRVRNNLEQFATFQEIFFIIEIFIMLMGGCTLVAGIVGVSNIMMIVVKERTKEIGIRKALGATPWTIVSTILQESVFLTAVAGYLGLVAGVGLLELIAAVVPDNDFFGDPAIDLTIALGATAVLVAAGALAGFVPAWSAARVSPVVALRDE